MRRIMWHWAHTLQRTDSRLASQGVVTNFLLQPSQARGGYTPFSLVPRPGICAFPTEGRRIIGAFTSNGRLYLISNEEVLQATLSSGNLLSYAVVGAHELALKTLRIAVGDGEVLYTDGSKLYSFIPSLAANRSKQVATFADDDGIPGGEAGSALAATDLLPSDIIDVTWANGRFVIAVNETLDFVERSFIFPSHLNAAAAADGRAFRVTDRTSAAARPDGITALGAISDDLYVFGSESCEVFYNSGDVNEVLRRYPQGSIEIGCISKFSIVQIDERLYFVDPQGGVYFVQGAQVGKVSTPAEDRLLSGVLPERAVGWGLEWRSHKLYHVKVPNQDAALVHDAFTGLWHRNRVDGGFHHSICYWNGRVWGVSNKFSFDEIACDTHSYYGEPPYYEAVSEPFSLDEKLFLVPNAEFVVNMGDGDSSMFLDFSWDDGQSWKPHTEIRLHRPTKGGELGTRPRALLYGLGQGRRLTLRLRAQTYYPLVLNHMVLSING